MLPQKLRSSCQQEFFKTEETNVQGDRNFHILMINSNYAININLIVVSMMAASTKTLQIISVTVLKIIFKRHSGKDGLWTHSLDAWVLGLWTLGLRTTGRLDCGHLESGRLEVRALTLGLWTLACLDCCSLDAWTFTFGLLDNRLNFNNYTFSTKGIL